MKKFSLHLLPALVLALATRAAAVEFTFSPSGSQPYDLADLANYSGAAALPGAGDVVVWDLEGATAASSLTLSAPLALDGLRIDNLDVGLTIESENTLTLGASGLTVTRPAGTITTYPDFNVRVPLAITAATTLHFGWTAVHYYSSISGTANLTITGNYQPFIHAETGYDGEIYYYNNGQIRNYSAGQWANTLRFLRNGDGRDENDNEQLRGGDNIILQAQNQTVPFRTLCPGGSLVVENGYNVELNDGMSITDVDVGDEILVSHRFMLYNGNCTMIGGLLRANELAVGTDGGNRVFTLEGGVVSNNFVHIGRNNGSMSARHALVQNGGEVHTKHVAFAVGNSQWWGRAEYEMNGGLLDATLAEDESGIHLSWPHSQPVSGNFKMTGGTVDTSRIALGRVSDPSAMLSNTVTQLTMDAGVMNVGAGGIVPGSVKTDDGYALVGHRLQFNGGTLAFANSAEVGLPIAFNGEGGGATVSVAANADVLVNAPLYGRGGLVKAGAGSMTVTDALDFTGDLAVNGGTFTILGAGGGSAPGGEIGGPDCFVWRADSAADAGAENGDFVYELRDVVHNELAYNSGGTVDGKNVAAPKLVLGAFNGHAGLEFSASALEVASSGSPAAGQREWSVAVVFKTVTLAQNANAGAWYNNDGICGYEQGGVQCDWGLSFGGLGSASVVAGVGYQGYGDFTQGSAGDVTPLNDGAVHVAVYSVRDTKMSLNVDGVKYERLYTYGGGLAHNDTKMLIGYQAQGDLGGNRGFKGVIAELRAYRGHALSELETGDLVYALSQRYGGSAPAPTVSVNGDMSAAAKPVPALAATAASWTADTLNDDNADLAEITLWPSDDGQRKAYNRVAGKSPVLVKNAMNGHSVLRFDNPDNSAQRAFAVAAADSPASGSHAFTVAVVFRTSAEIANDADNFWSGQSLLNTEHPGLAAGDWGLVLHRYGRVTGGVGGVGDGNWSRMVQGKSVDLNDGLPHVAIYSYSAASDRVGNYTQSLMIDGLAVRIHDRLDTPLARGDYEVCVGSCYTESDKWFNGDIAAFRLYGSALSYDDMRELSEAYAAKYGIELMRSDIGFGETRYYGLGAKNVSVGADGVLQLTYASTTPYTLKDGARATGSGQVKGVLGVGADGTLDIGSGLVIESLRVVDGGTLEVPSFQDYTQATVGDLSLSGQIAISIPDNAQVPAGGMVLLQPTGTLSVASGTTFVVEGGVGRYEARVVSGKLRLTTGSGMMIIFR